eukprot:gnl/MRDRNA2_/MRDRNA2_129951_c0_seq1.p1 gnl/MRDRNA2_/MRDRNA2_129951_c0~~gnl/MRDRNA2_/MRDRNA2_129951_c0_seq1.p1  ORF type:complete len:235 (-),score=52.13 gnl/MRDRNA2_/MRDRNA2_129951_c0_seq1:50-754(-)
MGLLQQIGGLVLLPAVVSGVSHNAPDELNSLKSSDPSSYDIVQGLLKKRNMGLLNYRHPSKVGLSDDQSQPVANAPSSDDLDHDIEMDPPVASVVVPAPAEDYVAESMADHSMPQQESHGSLLSTARSSSSDVETGKVDNIYDQDGKDGMWSAVYGRDENALRANDPAPEQIDLSWSSNPQESSPTSAPEAALIVKSRAAPAPREEFDLDADLDAERQEEHYSGPHPFGYLQVQ